MSVWDEWKNARNKSKFSALGVGIADGVIYRLSNLLKPVPIGPLSGAVAEVTDGTSRHTLTRVVTVVGAFSKKTNAVAVVVSGDGQVHQRKLEGAALVRAAQAQAVAFNAAVHAYESPLGTDSAANPPAQRGSMTSPSANDDLDYAPRDERIRKFREQQGRTGST